MDRNRYFFLVLSFGAVVMSAAALLACPASLDDFCSDGACDASALIDGSGNEAGPSVTPLDPCASKPLDATCFNNLSAFFVSAAGDDSAAGSKEAPFKTITHALGQLSAAKPRMYVCAGTYPEDVKVDGHLPSISIFGGLTCPAWSPTSEHPKVGTSIPALKLDGARGLSVVDVDFASPNAADAGASSFTTLAVNSDATLQRVVFTAGNGSNGANGTTPSQTPGPVTGLDDGGTVTLACSGGGTSVGGPCGTAATLFAGQSGLPKINGHDNGGPDSNCGNVPVKGLDATQQGSGGGPSPTIGHLDETGWLASSGTAGGSGSPGQGGGGGYTTAGGNGGGGGTGTCGGAGGTGGGGGGGSIGVAALNSTLVLVDCSISIGSGGTGGDGASGQVVTAAGAAGGKGVSTGCAGGQGGHGSQGGNGSGGAAGLAASIIWRGTAPTTTRVAYHGGTTGKPGAGPGQAGPSTTATDVLEVQ